MFKQYELLTILIVLFLGNCQDIVAVYEAPKQMQASQFEINGNWTSISSGTNYDIPYRDGFTIAGSGIGCIVLSSFGMGPQGDVLFHCRSNNIGGSSIRVKCTVNAMTYLSFFTFSYFVVDSSQYNSLAKSIIVQQSSLSLTNEVGVILKNVVISQFTPNNKYRCFIYLRGFEYKNSLKNYRMNQTCDQVNGQYYIRLSVYKQVEESTLHYTVVGLNMYELMINNNYEIFQQIQKYKNNVPLNYFNNPFEDKSQVVFLVGLKSISIKNSSNYSSLAIFTNVNLIYTFDENSTYNQVQIMFFSYIKCPISTNFIDRINLLCKNSRNGCSQYYQKINLAIPATSNLRAANVHGSYKIISYNLADYIEILRYNGTQFIQFYKILDPSTSGIVDYEMSQDYSRVAFITLSSAFYIYAWNGSDYVEEYKYSGQMGEVRSFISFDVTSDFKVIGVLSVLTGNWNYVLSTFIYNGTVKNYLVKESLMPSSVVKIFVRDHGRSAYVFSNKNFYHMTLSLALGRFVSDYEIVGIEQSSILVDIAVAPHSQKIAIQYYRKIPGLNEISYGIKILEYDISQKNWIVSRIGPQIFMPYSNNFHRVIFSKYGKELIVKPISGSYLVIFNKVGVKLGDSYKIKEVIGKVPGSVYSGTINNNALAVSSGLQFILSGDTGNSIVLYYCKSIINRPNRTYEIPKAQALSEPVIVIPTPVDPIPEQNNNEEIQELENEINKSQTVSKIMLGLGIVSLSGIIILSLYLLYKKLQATTATNSTLNTQLDINNPTRTNLDFQQSFQANNLSSLSQ